MSLSVGVTTRWVYNLAMKKALILLADGFEQVEALATHDVFHRSGGIKTTLASIKDNLELVTSSGVHVKADALLSDLDLDEYDFIVLPGGKLGVENLGSSPLVKKALEKFHDEGKHIHAICAAPSILGGLGYLDGKNYVCFPGFQKGNGHWQDTGVVKDGGTITGRSMGYSVDFACAIASFEVGEGCLKNIYAGIRGE